MGARLLSSAKGESGAHHTDATTQLRPFQSVPSPPPCQPLSPQPPATHQWRPCLQVIIEGHGSPEWGPGQSSGQSHYPALIWGVSGINHHRPHSPPHACLNRAPCQACLRQFPHVNNTSISPMQQIRHNWPPPGPYFLLLIMIRCGILSSLMPFRRLQRFLFNYAIVRF